MTFRFKGSKAMGARNLRMAHRRVLILFLILILSPLGCTPAGIATPLQEETATAAPPTLTAVPTDTAIPATDLPTATLPPTEESEPVSASTPRVFIAEADARVRESSPSTNDGEDDTLQVDGASSTDMESFIRFTLSDLTGAVKSARLRVYVMDNATDNGPAVYATDPSWTEGEITWDNRPERTSPATDNKGNLSANSWVEYDVTPLIAGEGAVSFVLVADSDDGVVFSSRQGVQPPELTVTFGSGQALPATVTSTLPASGAPTTGEAILVGAGDISYCDNDNDELTARLLDTIPGTVFTTGDNVYDRGSVDEYNTCYDLTWGRHKDRTRPVPGNHEYRTAGAGGYYQYFDGVPEYYAYDLGTWRIYALNSEIDLTAGSEQLLWLQTDLASNPRQCVLAYWHKPRWSSGEHHGSDRDIQPLWQTLYEAGAELVLNGHEHNYERFAEMDDTGTASSPGIREIVIGTGGRNHYEFDTPLPASEVRDATSYGVLKLTLREGGYAWEFIPAEGSTFTDSGSGTCH